MPASDPRPERPTARRDWWIWFGWLLLALLAWGWSTPIFAAPDEQAHATRSAVMIRGQLKGTDKQTAFGLVSEVTAPRWLESLNPICFIQKLEVTPTCVTAPVTDSGTYVTAIVMGGFSPLYAWAIGVPTTVLSGDVAIHLMRALGALVSAALLASAFASARRLGRWAVVGVFAALTPMVLYLGAVINPNGVEIMGALTVWISVAALARAGHIDELLVARIAIAYVICVNTRALALPMVTIALLVPMLLADRDRLRAIAAIRHVRAWIGVAAVSVVVQLGWLASVGAKRDLLPRIPFTFLDGLGRTWEVFVEAIATFGWTDVEIPGLAVLWLVAFAALVLVALAHADRRDAAVLIGLIVATVVLPIFVRMAQLPRLHSVWLGRYGLPLTVGVPILAGVIIATRAPRLPEHVANAAAASLTGTLALGQVLAFWVTARRYGTGTSGRVLYFLDARWSPPLPALALIAAFATAIGVLAWRSAWAVSQPFESPTAEADLVVTADT